MHRLTPFNAINNVLCPFGGHLRWQKLLLQSSSTFVVILFLVHLSIGHNDFLPSASSPVKCRWMRIIIVFLTCSALENEDALGGTKGVFCFWNK